MNQRHGVSRLRRVARADPFEAGYSMLELIMVVAIMIIVSGIAIYVTTNLMPTLRADQGLQVALAQVRQAREAAVDQRRTVTVTFKGTNEILIQRNDINVVTGATAGQTTIGDIFLPTGVVWTLYTGVGDTPDAYGNAASISFTSGIVNFMGDGAATDSSGNYVSGTVFMGIPNKRTTARAVTITGATGRIRSYRYNGAAWN